MCIYLKNNWPKRLHKAVGSGRSFQEVLPRKTQGSSKKDPQGVPKVSPRPPKAAPKPPKATPRPPQASPKAPQGVPEESPKAVSKDSKDCFKILEKPKKNNRFPMIFKSVWASNSTQVGLSWLMLAPVGLSWLQIGPS